MARLALAVVVASAVALSPAASAALDVAVVVNPQNPRTSLSVADLREILLMERQFWEQRRRIHLLLPETGSAEKEVILGRLLRMTDGELRRHFLQKLYSGEISSFPPAESSAATKRIVARAPHAIGLLDATAVDGTVKVIRLDGRRPGEPGYLLASR